MEGKRNLPKVSPPPSCPYMTSSRNRGRPAWMLSEHSEALYFSALLLFSEDSPEKQELPVPVPMGRRVLSLVSPPHLDAPTSPSKSPALLGTHMSTAE